MPVRRGDTVSSTVLFLIVLVVAIVIATWYIQSVRPARVAIATVLDDMDELHQHISNACSVSVYRAVYAVRSRGNMYANSTHYCITTDVFGSCKQAPCPIAPAQLALDGTPTIVQITGAPGANVTLGT